MGYAAKKPIQSIQTWALHVDSRLDVLERLISELTKAVEASLMVGGSDSEQVKRNLQAIEQLKNEL